MKTRECIDCGMNISDFATRCGTRVRVRLYKKNKRWRQNNKEEITRRRKKKAQDLTNSYIVQILSNPGNTMPLKTTEIPSKLIKLKREQVQLLRELGKIKKERESKLN